VRGSSSMAMPPLASCWRAARAARSR